MLVACLWPFEFHPPNDVRYAPGKQGLRFHGYGTAYSRDSFPSLRELSESDELTVDITAKPQRIFNSGVPNILSFCAAEGTPALVIGASRKSLVIRLGRPGNPGWKKYREIGVGDVFATDRTVHLVISLSPKGTTIFVDGHFKRAFPEAIIDTPDAPIGRLLLGNSLTGGSLWRGDILALTLYEGALAPAETAREEATGRPIAHYKFDTIQGHLVKNTSGPRYDIVLPTYFSPLRRMILEPPRGGTLLTLSSLKDIVLNILGFIPFGVLAMFSRGAAAVNSPRQQSTLVVLAGFSLSLGIELLQAFLPTRSSSLTDLATNTFGSALGVSVFFLTTPNRIGKLYRTISSV